MKKLLYYFVLLCTLVSCKNNEETELAESLSEIKFVAQHPSLVTRATETSFEQHDQIGVFMNNTKVTLELVGNVLDNKKLEFDGVNWTSAKKIYWDNGTYDVYAYYPYSENLGSVTDYKFSVQQDQTEATSYSASDFLWAKANAVTASDQAVTLPFKHCLSRLMINLKKSDNYEGEIPEDAEVYIYNTVVDAIVDLNVGVPIKDSRATVKTIHARKLGRGVYSAIVVPQRIDTRMPLIEIVSHGVSYFYEAKFLFRSGVQHNVDLYMSKNPDQLRIDLGGEIVNW